MKILPIVALSSIVVLPASLTLAASMTLAQATERALQEVPGGTVDSVENDFKRGRAVIEVEIDAPDGHEHEIVFDTESGKLLWHRIDD
jgi:uncharacterized membrane protein YkoI